jgi:hypothetical protein
MLQPMPELLEKMFWKVDFKVTGPSDPLLDEMLLPELRYLCSYRTLSIKLAIWGHGL